MCASTTLMKGVLITFICGSSGKNNEATLEDLCDVLNNDGSANTLANKSRLEQVSYQVEKELSPHSPRCGLYMAESSIPNSGFGMYTAVDIPSGQAFSSEIVINLADYQKSDDIIDRYSWISGDTLSIYEADNVESLVPGLGSLANSHPGLVNAKSSPPKIDSAGLHRYSDPGVGAFSQFHGMTYTSTEHIPAGMELFVDYGEEYFVDVLENDFVAVPMSEDYEEADDIIWRFWNLVHGEINTTFAGTFWDFLRNLVTYEERLLAALPSNPSHIPNALKQGTAMFSVPNVVKTPEWLEENGRCLDNIQPGRSTVEQAGRGAFATRPLSKGNVIAPAPLLHVKRGDSLNIYVDELDDGKVVEVEEYQQFLNYCFSHRNSSILLFPYAPIVNLINHDSKAPNAYIRWSNAFFHKSDWLNRIVEDILSNEEHAGLMLEFVASRDIDVGEEIFIDYGEGWEEAWNEHVASWKPDPHDQHYVPVSTHNDRVIVLTSKEQESNPYPDDVTLACYNSIRPSKMIKSRVYEWAEKENLLHYQSNSFPCKILSRDETNAYVVEFEGGSIVRNVPRKAIQFSHKKYMSDQFIPNVFRHEMEIPDYIFPEVWMDE